MTLIYGLCFIAIVVAGVVLRDRWDRWRPPERRGFEVIGKEQQRG